MRRESRATKSFSVSDAKLFGIGSAMAASGECSDFRTDKIARLRCLKLQQHDSYRNDSTLIKFSPELRRLKSDVTVALRYAAGIFTVVIDSKIENVLHFTTPLSTPSARRLEAPGRPAGDPAT